MDKNTNKNKCKKQTCTCLKCPALMQTTVANIKYNEKEKNICFMHNYLKIQFTKLKRPALALIRQYSYKTNIGKCIGAIQNVCLEGGG